MKKVLICTNNYFTSKYQVGSQSYAKAFEKLGYKVAYISNPISPLHHIFANNEDLIKRNEIYKSKGMWDGNIWYYVPKSYITPQNKPILSSKFIFKNWNKFLISCLCNILKKNGFDTVDIFWCESPVFHILFDKIKYKKSIYRLADYSKGFKNNWNLIEKNELRLLNKVDKVIYTAKNIKQQYNSINDSSKMLYIPNGIDLDFIKSTDKTVPKEFENIEGPIVIYVGLIDYWFDIDLISKSALAYPSYSFVLIGDFTIDLASLKKLSNVYILGAIQHKYISNYLANSDIGIIPFKKDDFVDSINPIKLYEYAAYDLKIVTTSWKEIDQYRDIIKVSKNHQDFIDNIKFSKDETLELQSHWLKEQQWDTKLTNILKNL